MGSHQMYGAGTSAPSTVTSMNLEGDAQERESRLLESTVGRGDLAAPNDITTHGGTTEWPSRPCGHPPRSAERSPGTVDRADASRPPGRRSAGTPASSADPAARPESGRPPRFEAFAYAFVGAITKSRLGGVRYTR